MVKKYLLLFLVLNLCVPGLLGQVGSSAGPVLSGRTVPNRVAPLSTREIIRPEIYDDFPNPKEQHANQVVPGKGYPRYLDAALQSEMGVAEIKSPIFVADALTTGHVPTDPTGAVGPNHYVVAVNSAFAIYDKEGNLLSPQADLSTLGGEFQGENFGDPIVMYDQFADRFLITQYSHTPNSLLVAISQGPNPVTDGWYTYRFETGSFPDYPKFYIWGDGYYVTTNKVTKPILGPGDNNSPDYQGEVIYVLERDKMVVGEPARYVGLPLPGLEINQFYSPAGFLPLGEALPPPGNAPIVYFQDDSWAGVNQDHLKIWLVNVNWDNPEATTIVLSQRLGPDQGVTPFHSVFDGGSQLNLSQPDDGVDLDALQGAIMYPAHFRSFDGHNAAVFNFVVDVDPGFVEHAGIRWYELRQEDFGAPWEVYQEGTYAPDFSDRWCGSIGIDKHGNIGLGFTIMNDNEEHKIYASLKYTGRYANDPPGIMTLQEEFIVEGNSISDKGRYGDYSHLSLDPTDDETFWFIGEYFDQGLRASKFGAFKIAPTFDRDIGIVDILTPESAVLGENETVTVVIRNYGAVPQTGFELWYALDGGTIVRETFPGTIQPTDQASYTFATKADLSELGEHFINAKTDLEGDQEFTNDFYKETIYSLRPTDVGVTEIHSPQTGTGLGIEPIAVTVENFGGVPQQDFPIGYSINGGEMVIETFDKTVEFGEEVSFVFENQVDLSSPTSYEITVTTLLEGDVDRENDSESDIIANMDCIPEGSNCLFNDGIFSFYLEEIVNENIPCTNGYIDFIGGFSTTLDRSASSHTVGIEGGSGDRFSIWIDFNDNAVFESDELIIDSELIRASGMVLTFPFDIPDDAPLGEHLMRVRGGDVSPQYSGSLNDPCSVMEYGTTHDYSVIIESSLEESVLQQAELIVTSPSEDFFQAHLTTPYQDFLWISVYDIRGQKLIENRVDKLPGGYFYEFDMSHVASGVYLVRMGTREEGRVERILVE